MSGRLRHFLLCLFCLVAMAHGSVTSAAMMAPERHPHAMMQCDMPDGCGDMHDMGHDHRCPYCHLLPEVSVPGPVDVVRRFLPVSGWRQAHDLHRRAQARDHARSPRAPPYMA